MYESYFYFYFKKESQWNRVALYNLFVGCYLIKSNHGIMSNFFDSFLLRKLVAFIATQMTFQSIGNTHEFQSTMRF